MSFSRCLQLRKLPAFPRVPSLRLKPPAFSFRPDQQSRVLQTSTTPEHSNTAYFPSNRPAIPSLYLHRSKLRPSMATVTLSQTATQARSHAGHSHHHHDNTYLVSKNKNDAGVRITRIGLFANLGMAIAKGTGGYLFNSQAMIADAWVSVSCQYV
jgi:hypothetical protein